MSTYTTVSGDMWDLISYRLTGNNGASIPIMQANPQYTDTFIFPAGVTLVIPDLEDIEDDTMVVPPWQLEEGED